MPAVYRVWRGVYERTAIGMPQHNSGILAHIICQHGETHATVEEALDEAKAIGGGWIEKDGDVAHVPPMPIYKENP